MKIYEHNQFVMYLGTINVDLVDGVTLSFAGMVELDFPAFQNFTPTEFGI